MPLTDKGSKIMSHMKEQYGSEKGEQVFYASKNKGTITGVDGMGTRLDAIMSECDGFSKKQEEKDMKRYGFNEGGRHTPEGRKKKPGEAWDNPSPSSSKFYKSFGGKPVGK